LIRFHFAKQTPTLQAAGERLLKLRVRIVPQFGLFRRSGPLGASSF
jgi:hypothetical protein